MATDKSEYRQQIGNEYKLQPYMQWPFLWSKNCNKLLNFYQFMLYSELLLNRWKKYHVYIMRIMRHFNKTSILFHFLLMYATRCWLALNFLHNTISHCYNHVVFNDFCEQCKESWRRLHKVALDFLTAAYNKSTADYNSYTSNMHWSYCH